MLAEKQKRPSGGTNATGEEKAGGRERKSERGRAGVGDTTPMKKSKQNLLSFQMSVIAFEES